MHPTRRLAGGGSTCLGELQADTKPRIKHDLMLHRAHGHSCRPRRYSLTLKPWTMELGSHEMHAGAVRTSSHNGNATSHACIAGDHMMYQLVIQRPFVCSPGRRSPGLAIAWRRTQSPVPPASLAFPLPKSSDGHHSDHGGRMRWLQNWAEKRLADTWGPGFLWAL